MRVTHITNWLDINNGAGATKLLEALVDYSRIGFSWLGGSVELEFHTTDCFGESQVVTVRMDGLMELVQHVYGPNEDDYVTGYRFDAIMGSDLVTVEYYLNNPDNYRGSITDRVSVSVPNAAISVD